LTIEQNENHVTSSEPTIGEVVDDNQFLISDAQGRYANSENENSIAKLLLFNTFIAFENNFFKHVQSSYLHFLYSLSFVVCEKDQKSGEVFRFRHQELGRLTSVSSLTKILVNTFPLPLFIFALLFILHIVDNCK
jgi:hypothetical protein